MDLTLNRREESDDISLLSGTEEDDNFFDNHNFPPENDLLQNFDFTQASFASLSSADSISRMEMEKEELDAQEKIKSLQGRLKRRNILLETIRTAYLRDVVSIKTIISTVLQDHERYHVMKQWETVLPSLDLRGPIALCAPFECELHVIACEGCGSTVEIFHREQTRSEIKSSMYNSLFPRNPHRFYNRLYMLEESLKDYRRRQEEFRLEVATKDAIIEMTKKKVIKLSY